MPEGLQQLGHASLRNQALHQKAVQWWQRHRTIAQHLGGDATGAESNDRTKHRIINHTQQQFAAVGTHTHGLDGHAIDNRIGQRRANRLH